MVDSYVATTRCGQVAVGNHAPLCMSVQGASRTTRSTCVLLQQLDATGQGVQPLVKGCSRKSPVPLYHWLQKMRSGMTLQCTGCPGPAMTLGAHSLHHSALRHLSVMDQLSFEWLISSPAHRGRVTSDHGCNRTASKIPGHCSW